jgi:hypothetical protein
MNSFEVAGSFITCVFENIIISLVPNAFT